MGFVRIEDERVHDLSPSKLALKRVQRFWPQKFFLEFGSWLRDLKCCIEILIDSKSWQKTSLMHSIHFVPYMSTNKSTSPFPSEDSRQLEHLGKPLRKNTWKGKVLNWLIVKVKAKNILKIFSQTQPNSLKTNFTWMF